MADGKCSARGVWPVMVTPFTEDNRIDYNGVEKIIEWYDKMGVDGIFAVCQSSEMFELDAEERFELGKFVMEHAPKHMSVVCSGHVAEKVEDQIREAQRMIDAGCKEYVFISNQLAKEDESEDVVKRRVEYLLNHIQADGFGIYECPYPYKRVLSAGLLRWLALTGKFKFLKDTCCDVLQLKAKADAVRGTGLKIYNANGATLLQSLKDGCAGYSGVMANFYPDLISYLVKNFEDDSEIIDELMDFIGAASTIEYQCYPVNAKYYLQLEGLPITTKSRKQNDRLLTASKKLEIEQYKRVTERFRAYFCEKVRR